MGRGEEEGHNWFSGRGGGATKAGGCYGPPTRGNERKENAVDGRMKGAFTNNWDKYVLTQ